MAALAQPFLYLALAFVGSVVSTLSQALLASSGCSSFSSTAAMLLRTSTRSLAWVVRCSSSQSTKSRFWSYSSTSSARL